MSNASTATHAPGSQPGRAACGRRTTALAADPTCSNCLAAIRADQEAQ